MAAQDNNKHVLKIDLSVWTTQNKYALENNVRLNTISQQIKRHKEGKTKTCVEYWDIPELCLTLVKK